MKNRIYFFTGTGNSLKVAKDIANSLPNCEIVGIHRDASIDVSSGYERIGFVFPVYFYGLPHMVEDFVKRLKITKDTSKYYFAVKVPGGFSGTAVVQLSRLLKDKGIDLNYGTKIRLNANYIVRYGSIGLYKATAMKSYPRKIKKAILDIGLFKKGDIDKYKEKTEKTYREWISTVSSLDEGYNVNDKCNSCGTCVKVCPAKNIALENGKPIFDHRCESCMACIQFCPKRAINYKDKTEKRKHYTHPDIKSSEISRYYLSDSKSSTNAKSQ